MTSETDSSGRTTFTYNENNQLIAENGPGGSFQYSYDALGNLVATTQNGATTDYVNDPLSMSASGRSLTSIAQMYVSGTLAATYDYGLGLAVAIDEEGEVSYFDTDLTGNVTGISGPSGSPSASYFYLPFGSVSQINGISQNVFLFSGSLGVTNAGGGLVDMRARYYDPQTGRFISPDPIGLLGGSNGYEFGANNPIIFEDPTGTNVVYQFVKDQVSGYTGGQIVKWSLWANGGWALPPDVLNTLSDATFTGFTIGGDLAEAESAWLELQVAAESGLPWVGASELAPLIERWPASSRQRFGSAKWILCR
jgi:RHS repeat-associated protein